MLTEMKKSTVCIYFKAATLKSKAESRHKGENNRRTCISLRKWLTLKVK